MRRLILVCALSLAILIAVGLVVVPSKAAATIIVTTTSDTLDNTDGLCSLREAIIAANTDSAIGGCVSGSGADTINFDAALTYPATIVLTQTGANEDAALTGDLDISGTLTIDGPGAQLLLIDGNHTDRVFEIRSGARVTVHGLTAQHGNPGAADGGGILIDQTGALTLTNSLIFSNTAVSGGGLKTVGILRVSNSSVERNQGGGLRNENGALTLNNVDVISNTGGYGVTNGGGLFTYKTGRVSGNQGGGITNFSNPAGAELSNLTIMYNTGSGVANSGVTFATSLVLMQSQVLSNTAATGAGVTNNGDAAIMNIYQSRLAYNVASASGGGAWNWGAMSIVSSTIDHNTASNGAGIRHNKGNLALTNDTISFNAATNNGGGLYSEDNALLTNVTIDANHTNGAPDTGGGLFLDNSSLSLKNTIVSGNGPEGNCGFNPPVFMNSVDHNLDSGATCDFAATGDITNTNPLLGLLQDNGGSTLTQALPPTSPAIDHGTNSGCPATDQRGLHRPQGSNCDMGAYEVGDFADLAISKQALSGMVGPGLPLTYTISVTNSGPLTATGVTLIDHLPPNVIIGGMAAIGWSCSGTSTTITCTIPSLALTSDHLTLTVTAPLTLGQMVNSVSISSTTPDLNLGNNTASATVEVVDLTTADLSLVKHASMPVVTAGNALTYTLSITNAGPAPAHAITVTDQLPPQSTDYVGAAGEGWLCDQANGVIACTRSELSLTLTTIVITAAAPLSTMTLSNTAVIAAATFDPNADNNSSTAVAKVIKLTYVFLPLILRDG